MAIMQAESGCRSQAYNGTLNTDGTNDAGLFQVNSIHNNTKSRFDPETNVKLAYGIYRGRTTWDSNGWRAWSVYNNNKYKEFL